LYFRSITKRKPGNIVVKDIVFMIAETRFDGDPNFDSKGKSRGMMMKRICRDAQRDL
jgi:hypothetical protein